MSAVSDDITADFIIEAQEILDRLLVTIWLEAGPGGQGSSFNHQMVAQELTILAIPDKVVDLATLKFSQQAAVVDQDFHPTMISRMLKVVFQETLGLPQTTPPLVSLAMVQMVLTDFDSEHLFTVPVVAAELAV